ncbi:ATP-binding cassette domain-containing protein [Bacillus sp. REN10]|uniref:ATP-binding cassette domain-containing protein n=1 Tax=Bacillus sp. REN10 TaxID=2782541 RepID=UPI00193C15DC|nr:ATP-binding cassette domain-containing protein [Bacillus sp. REN10]
MRTIIESIQADVIRNGQPILSHIDVKISEGMSIVITGANGSGKSSLIKLLAGMYEPQNGKVNKEFQSYAYIPEHFPEHLPFTVDKYLKLMMEMGGNTHQERLDLYIERLGLRPFLHTPLKKCSKGTKQKAGIIQALMKRSDVLFLDEPLTGLDKVACETVIDLFLELKGEKTMVFVLHEESPARKLATHLAKLENGRLVNFSAVEPTKRHVHITFTAKQPLSKQLQQKVKQVTEQKMSLTVAEAESDLVLAELLKQGAHIVEVKVGRNV